MTARPKLYDTGNILENKAVHSRRFVITVIMNRYNQSIYHLPAAQSQSEENNGCEITLVPHVLDVSPHHLEYGGAAHKEGLSTR